jgi:hypothetical protein
LRSRLRDSRETRRQLRAARHSRIARSVAQQLAQRSHFRFGVPLRRTRSTPPASAPRVTASANPLRTMLELSAAMRAVADQPLLRPAVAVLQREACRLTGAAEATVIAIDRARGTVWTRDGSAISDEIHDLVAQVAESGRRALSGHALFEPIGGPPARAVLALRRHAYARFETEDIALVAALSGGVAATLNRLIDAATGHP